MNRIALVKPVAMVLSLVLASAMLAGCGQSDKERAMKAGAAGPSDQLRQRVIAQADR